MRVSMGSLQDHCPSLSPLFPWLQDALLGSPSPPTHAFSVPLPRLHPGHRPRLSPEPLPLTAVPHSLWPHQHCRSYQEA